MCKRIYCYLCFIVSFVIFILVAVLIYYSAPSNQHFISVNDPCYLANACNHTWLDECGEDKSHTHKRLFLDECDRHEFNCDNKKDYIKVDMTECQDIVKEDTVLTSENTSKLTTVTTNPTTTTESTTISTIASITTENVTEITTTESTTQETTTAELTTETTSTIITTDETLIAVNDTETATLSVLTTTPSTEVTKIEFTTQTMNETTSNNIVVEASSTTASTMCTRPPKNITSGCNNETDATTQPTETPSTTAEITTTTIKTSSTENTTTEPATTTGITTSTTAETTTTTESANTTTVETGDTVSNVTTETNVAASSPCDAYPKDCERPVTWETTVEGETRDFFQILKERFGRRARFMKYTTHWPKNIGLNLNSRKLGTFWFGNHIETSGDRK